jgi:SecA DEAD-like domain
MSPCLVSDRLLLVELSTMRWQCQLKRTRTPSSLERKPFCYIRAESLHLGDLEKMTIGWRRSVSSRSLSVLLLGACWSLVIVVPAASPFAFVSPELSLKRPSSFAWEIPRARGATTAACPTSTALSMGIMEDFLTGQDKSSREKENKKYLEALQERVNRINALEADVEALDDDELVAKTQEFRERLASGEDLNGKLLEEAFAVVREAAW